MSDYIKAAMCAICDATGIEITGKDLYPHRPDLYTLKFYKCPKCPNSYVGCHKANGVPLGTMADADLRKLRGIAHGLLDPFWKNKRLTRFDCYKKLSNGLKIAVKDCHIGQFNKEMTKKAIEELKTWKI